MHLFEDKNFSFTFKADFSILLALFVLCMIGIAALIYNPGNRSVGSYRKRLEVSYEPNQYTSNPTNTTIAATTSNANNGSIETPYPSENPFNQEYYTNSLNTKSPYNNRASDIPSNFPDLHTVDTRYEEQIPLEPISFAVQPKVSNELPNKPSEV